MKNKIFSVDNLRKIIDKEKLKGKKITLCHGVFDLLHIGHIKHFKESKKFGDILVVTLTPDIFVNKGPERPAFNEKLRLEGIASLDSVDAPITPCKIRLSFTERETSLIDAVFSLSC